MAKLVFLEAAGDIQVRTESSHVEVLRWLLESWGESSLRKAFLDLGVECPGQAGGVPFIEEVVPSIVNVQKKWYEAGTELGPYNKHPEWAADWNLESMGDTDLGEPICSPFDGLVINAEDYGGAWGKIVRVIGLDTFDNVAPVVWMGAHFKEIKTRVGDVVTPGQVIATVGKGTNNMYSAHLHEQISKGRVTAPTAFIAGDPFVTPFDFYVSHGVDRELMERLYRKDNA